MLKVWESVVPEEERMIFKKAGFEGLQQLGNRPALLVIDVVESFVGTKPQHVMDAIEEFTTSCGNSGWEAIPHIRHILKLARSSGMEVIYTKGSVTNKMFCGSSTKRDADRESIQKTFSTPIVNEISPLEHEFVLEKAKASAFFGTPLMTYLVRENIDCLFVVGTSTSGCVRATVVDGISYGYPMFVIEEGCFDRSQFFHNVSLFDMHAKYGTVISVKDFESWVSAPK